MPKLFFCRNSEMMLITPWVRFVKWGETDFKRSLIIFLQKAYIDIIKKKKISKKSCSTGPLLWGGWIWWIITTCPGTISKLKNTESRSLLKYGNYHYVDIIWVIWSLWFHFTMFKDNCFWYNFGYLRFKILLS